MSESEWDYLHTQALMKDEAMTNDKGEWLWDEKRQPGQKAIENWQK